MLATGTSLSTSNTLRFEEVIHAPYLSNAVDPAPLNGEMWRSEKRSDLDLRRMTEEISGFAAMESHFARVP